VLSFRLKIPELSAGYSLGKDGYHPGYWGYTARQVNLGLWFPLVAAFDAEQGWQVTRYYSVGEQGILETADFFVELALQGAPDGVQIAGPGKIEHPDPKTWRFTLAGGRELALSLSEQFRTLQTVTPDGVNVEVFYLPDTPPGTLNAPRHVLNTATDALELYEQLYGPYPHRRMVIVEGDFPDGMEFSGLVYVSEAWFRTWLGSPDDWLTLITAHEVAHQWWYGLVGSDQGNAPYLDEALAIYSELLFLEHYYPDAVQWWWDFRINLYTPGGEVDAPVYDFYSVRGYINAVYLRGAMMMQQLRSTLGDKVFLGWLHDYAQVMRGQVAAPSDFWGMLSETDYSATASVRQAFLRQPDVLPRTDDLP
jgi:aminopeptidase N